MFYCSWILILTFGLFLTCSNDLCCYYRRWDWLYRNRSTSFYCQFRVNLLLNFRLLQIYHTMKIVFSIFIILIGILCLLSLAFNSKDIRICISYLKYAGNFFGKALILVVFIFVFYVLMAGLLGLMLFQILGYWSHGDVQFHP